MPDAVQAILIEHRAPLGNVRLAIDGETWIAQPPYHPCDRLQTSVGREASPPGLASMRARRETVYAWCGGLHDVRLAAHWVDRVAEVALAEGKQEHEVSIAEVLGHWMESLAPSEEATGQEAATPMAARRVAGLSDATWRHSLGCLAALHPEQESLWIRLLRHPRACIADDPSTAIWTLNRLPTSEGWPQAGRKAASCLLRALDPHREPTEVALVQSTKAWLAQGGAKAA